MTELRERVRAKTLDTIKGDYHKLSKLHICYSKAFNVSEADRVAFKAYTKCRTKVDNIIDFADNERLYILLRDLDDEIKQAQ